MMDDHIRLKNGNKTIVGQIFYNRQKRFSRVPVIIFSHGFMGNMYSCMKYKDKFCDEGYICVFFSFCGGGSEHDTLEAVSDGNSYDMTISSEIEDLLTVIDWVKCLDGIDRNKIILFGESQGGFVSALTAARIPEEIHRLVMVYPAFCIPDHARLGILGMGKYDPNNVPDRIPVNGTVIGKAFHDDVVNMNAYAEIGEFKRPVLIIHGDNDKVVKYDYSEKAQYIYGPYLCRLIKIRGMGHYVYGNYIDIVSQVTRQFLRGEKKLSTTIDEYDSYHYVGEPFTSYKPERKKKVKEKKVENEVKDEIENLTENVEVCEKGQDIKKPQLTKEEKKRARAEEYEKKVGKKKRRKVACSKAELKFHKLQEDLKIRKIRGDF